MLHDGNELALTVVTEQHHALLAVAVCISMAGNKQAAQLWRSQLVGPVIELAVLLHAVF